MKKRNFYYKFFKIPTRDEMLNIPTDDLYDIHTTIDEKKAFIFKPKMVTILSLYERMTMRIQIIYFEERLD